MVLVNYFDIIILSALALLGVSDINSDIDDFEYVKYYVKKNKFKI